jgi:serine O-acetyltransferase
MITSKQTLKEYLAADNPWQRPQNLKHWLLEWVASRTHWHLHKYLRLLRLEEYYANTGKSYRAMWYEGRKNRLGIRINLEICRNCFGKGLSIYHQGCIVNPAVRAGEGCTLHGANCIGNDGKNPDVPKLGDRVNIGYGAVIVGGITIADDVTIGANAVVIHSVTEPGCTVAGIPARIVRHGGSHEQS